MESERTSGAYAQIFMNCLKANQKSNENNQCIGSPSRKLVLNFENYLKHFKQPLYYSSRLTRGFKQFVQYLNHSSTASELSGQAVAQPRH